MPCTVCRREIKIVARGLCGACYQRWNKTGTTDYQRWGKRNVCQIKDCDSYVVSHGLCDMHRLRLRSHGHTDSTRPDSWGAKEKHPLYHVWHWLKRRKMNTPIVQIWVDDFLQFVTDVGERPSLKHKLFTADETQPLGPNNFIWKRSLVEKVDGENPKTYSARAQRVYRKIRPEGYRATRIQRAYGITSRDYEEMLLSQDGVCAICNKAETAKMKGKVMNLAIDHCHTTGKVRGLLCINCNKGMGHLRDDPEILSAAIEYLKKHN